MQLDICEMGYDVRLLVIILAEVDALCRQSAQSNLQRLVKGGSSAICPPVNWNSIILMGRCLGGRRQGDILFAV